MRRGTKRTDDEIALSWMKPYVTDSFSEDFERRIQRELLYTLHIY